MCNHLEFLHHPVDASVKTLGRRWATPVLLELLNGNNRFNTLLNDIPGINPRTPSTRLTEFQDIGLIKKDAASTTPSRVTYSLTPKGEEMRHLLLEIVGFSLKWHMQS